MIEEKEDGRIAYGASCTWWGSIYATGKHPEADIPCCPICHGMLFEMDSMHDWLKQAREFENDGHPGYCSFVAWLRGKCFKSFPAAILAYEQLTARSN